LAIYIYILASFKVYIDSINFGTIYLNFHEIQASCIQFYNKEFIWSKSKFISHKKDNPTEVAQTQTNKNRNPDGKTLQVHIDQYIGCSKAQLFSELTHGKTRITVWHTAHKHNLMHEELTKQRVTTSPLSLFSAWAMLPTHTFLQFLIST